MVDLYDDVSRAALEFALNSLWQGGAAALALAGLARVWRGASAATRYAIWCAALASLLLLPLASILTRPGPALVAGATAIDEAGDGPDMAPAAAPAAAGAARAATSAPPAPFVEVRGGGWTLWAFAALALVWAARLARVAVGCVGLARWRRRCRPLPPARVARLAGWRLHSWRGRSARLAASPDARSPMVLGLWRPVVAVPEGLVDRLSDQELDDIALHELAHVRRRDDWAKLAEALVAAVCFFHPAAWWLARRADADREVACDDWVVAATGKPGRYARSLLRLAGLGADRGAALAPGAFARKPMISERIELLMKTERNATPKVPRLILVSLSVLVLLATFASAGSGPAVGLSTMPLAELPPMPQPAARSDLADDTRGEDPVARAAALEALGDYAGTVVVMNPHDGRIYTIVNQEWAVRGGFAPASTAKLVTALAALDAGAVDPAVRVMAQGKRVDLDEAVAYSNTEYFQRIGERAGAERYLATARTLGLGSPTGVNLPGEYAGRLPERSVPAGLFGAGEGVEVTPMQLAVMVSALANGGTRVVPFVPRDGAAAAPGTPVAVRAEHLERLEPGMIGTVQYGTGGASALQGVTIAGKTGTALDPKGNLGLFISYAPVQSPQFVVVVVLRGHDVSGKTAAGVAGRLYNTLVEKFC